MDYENVEGDWRFCANKKCYAHYPKSRSVVHKNEEYCSKACVDEIKQHSILGDTGAVSVNCS